MYIQNKHEDELLVKMKIHVDESHDGKAHIISDSTYLSIYLLILPTPSRAFSAGDCASGCEKGKDKRMTVKFIQDDRLKLLARIKATF